MLTRPHPEAGYYGFAFLASALLSTWLCLSILHALALTYLTILACYDAREKKVLMRDAFVTCLLLVMCIPYDSVGYVFWLGLAMIIILALLKGHLGRLIGSIDVVLFVLCLTTLSPACFQSFFICTGLGMLALYTMTREKRLPFIVPLWASYIGHLTFFN
jgi:hypothetical protein